VSVLSWIINIGRGVFLIRMNEFSHKFYSAVSLGKRSEVVPSGRSGSGLG
jgi:hypothetical protein